MAALTGNAINSSYLGLLKTLDNAGLGVTEKNMTDGAGQASTISMGTGSASFVGTLDLTGATVTGLATAGLVAGTGAESIESAITTTPADASGAGAIALGDGATAVGADNISIGKNNKAGGTDQILIGDNIDGALYADNVVAIVPGGVALAFRGNGSVHIGKGAYGAGEGGVAIGVNAKTTNGGAKRAIAIGNGALGNGNYGVSVGPLAEVTGAEGVSLGYNTECNAAGAVALGAAVIANTIDTVSMKAIELQTNSTPTVGGIIVSDAGGTDRRINIDAAGALQVDATPVGGGAAGLVAGTGTDSIESAITTIPADASATSTIALGDSAVATSEKNIAIGKSANAAGDTAFARGNIAIGGDASATNEGDLAVGSNATASGSSSTAIGKNTIATGNRGVAVGTTTTASGFASVCVGNYSQAEAEGSVVLGGYNSSATQTNAIAIGKEADALAANGVALGYLAQATAADAVAIGANVTGAIANVVSMKAIELQTNSTPTVGGIIVSDAGGTDRRINITAAGALQIDATPVGGGGAAGLEVGTGTNSLQNAVGGASNASGAQSIALGNAATASGNQSMAYGDNALANSVSSAAFGQYAEATNNYAIAFGRTSGASGDGSVAFGQQAQAAQAGAVAMGRQVTSDTADTTHVRALKIVAPNGGTGGNGITMLSPNGTAYTLTVSDAGALIIA
jgi:hypothetical protein